MKTTKVLFLGQLPEHVSPSQRFRIEQYKPVLENASIQYLFQPFISDKYVPFLYKKGHLLKKVTAVLDGFWRRTKGLFLYRNVDFVFVQREASPIGPPVFEWAWSKLLRKKLIYDFDDSIWMANTSEGNKLAAHVKCFWKVGKICRWAWKVSVGNEFLAEYARRHNNNVLINPTCVNTEERYKRLVDHNTKKKVVLGWTGSHSTLPYLDLIYPVLKKLEEKLEFTLLVICDRPPMFQLKSMQFVKWNKDTEIEDLSKIDVGIMPLKTDGWAKGKCGFKIIQYMALGIPAVATRIGVNDTIIKDGVNGFTCTSDEDWQSHLTTLIENAQVRHQLGANGRERIVRSFSVSANSELYLSMFEHAPIPRLYPSYNLEVA